MDDTIRHLQTLRPLGGIVSCSWRENIETEDDEAYESRDCLDLLWDKIGVWSV